MSFCFSLTVCSIDNYSYTQWFFARNTNSKCQWSLFCGKSQYSIMLVWLQRSQFKWHSVHVCMEEFIPNSNTGRAYWNSAYFEVDKVDSVLNWEIMYKSFVFWMKFRAIQLERLLNEIVEQSTVPNTNSWFSSLKANNFSV